MTKEQESACMDLSIEAFEVDGKTNINNVICFEIGFRVAQTPETLILNPLVKKLVRESRFLLVEINKFKGAQELKWTLELEKALEPFKEDI